MAELLTIARPYANAIYQISRSQDSDTWYSSMKFCYTLSDNTAVEDFFCRPGITFEDVKSFLLTFLADSKISSIPKDFENLIEVLFANKRLFILPEIAKSFIELVNKNENILTVKLVTAKPISTKEKDELIDKLKIKYKKTIEVSIIEDSSLIGGAIIYIGDNVIDGSIKGRIEQLTSALNKY